MARLNDLPYMNLIEVYDFLNIVDKKKLTIALFNSSLTELLLSDIEKNETQFLIDHRILLSSVCKLNDSVTATKMIEIYFTNPKKYNYMVSQTHDNELYWVFENKMYTVLYKMIEMMNVNALVVYRKYEKRSLCGYLFHKADIDEIIMEKLLLLIVSQDEFCPIDNTYHNFMHAFIKRRKSVNKTKFEINKTDKRIFVTLITKFKSNNYKHGKNNNYTLLMDLILKVSEEMAILLLSVDDNCLHEYFHVSGSCALDYAFQNKYYILVEKLIDMYGSKYYTNSVYGRSRVYELAIKHGLIDCANRLLEKEGNYCLSDKNYVLDGDSDSDGDMAMVRKD
jgi:hypothetical protein